MSSSELIATCPKCGATHPVPIEAAGRPARCQTCGQIFLIPKLEEAQIKEAEIENELEELMNDQSSSSPTASGHNSEAEIDETVSTWLNEDFEEDEEERASKREKRLESEAYEHRRKQLRREEQEKILQASANPDFLETGGAQDTVMDEIDQRILEAQSRSKTQVKTDRTTEKKENKLREKISQEAVAAMNTPVSLTDDTLHQSSFETAAHPDRSSAYISTLGLPSDTNLNSDLGTTAEEVIQNLMGGGTSESLPKPEDKETNTFVGAVKPIETLPYLGVKNFDRLGVTLVFDSEWLKLESFRHSTPLRCNLTGETEVSKLIIRPFLFEGTLGDKEPERIDSIMQRPMMEDQPVAEAISLMGALEFVSGPYNKIMPYYVSEDQQFQRVRAWIEEDGGGHLICNVLIPDARTALLWVKEVNGVCDLGYRLLKDKVEKPQSSGMEAWVMERLSIWCKLEPGESIEYYVRDADLLAREEGLGGIVITNNRVIFHKAKKTGQFPIDEKALITIKPADDSIVRIAVDSRTIRSKMGKISKEKLPELLSHLAGRPNLSFFNM